MAELESRDDAVGLLILILWPETSPSRDWHSKSHCGRRYTTKRLAGTTDEAGAATRLGHLSSQRLGNPRSDAIRSVRWAIGRRDAL